jgi:hypothetical protein
MRKHKTITSAITLLILASLCLAQTDQGRKQTQQLTKPQTVKLKSAIAEKFVGTWKLLSIEDRRPNPPNREYNPAGYITYDSTGHMAVQIVRRSDRAKFASDEAAKATMEEKAAAYDSYAAYHGTYTINETEGTVTHHLEGSLNPNDVGKVFVRYFEFSGDRITLIPAEVNEGKPGAKSSLLRRLTWERVK